MTPLCSSSSNLVRVDCGSPAKHRPTQRHALIETFNGAAADSTHPSAPTNHITRASGRAFGMSTPCRYRATIYVYCRSCRMADEFLSLFMQPRTLFLHTTLHDNNTRARTYDSTGRRIHPCSLRHPHSPRRHQQSATRDQPDFLLENGPQIGSGRAPGLESSGLPWPPHVPE
jgi:hypothetical protein